MSLRTHWRILVGSTLALIAAAFLAPPFLPKPDLNEKRALAEAPAWPRDVSQLAATRKAADAWVSDHFPPRAQLISLINYLRLPFGVSGSDRVVVGRSGWLFYDNDTHLGTARGEPALDEAQARAWLMGLAGRTEALRARNIPFLLVVAPLKETVYPQQTPPWQPPPDPARAAPALAALAARTGAGEVLYLHAPLAQATRSGVKTFSAHDTHWTGAGAHAGYEALMRRLQQLGVGEAPRPLSAFVPKPGVPARDLALMLGVGGLVSIDYVSLSDPEAERRARIAYLSDKKDWTGPHVIETGQVGKPTALITVDSFSNAFLPFLYSHFSRLVVAHNQDGTWRQDLIDRFQPDVVLLEVVESGLIFSMDGGPAPSPQTAARLAGATLKPRASADAFAPGRLSASAADAPIVKALAEAPDAAGCDVENLSFARDGAGGPRVAAAGWMSALGKRLPPTEALLRLSGPGGDYFAPMRVDGQRPDIAERFGNPIARQSGFQVEASAADLPPGDYRLAVYRRTRFGGWIQCRAGRPLAVTP